MSLRCSCLLALLTFAGGTSNADLMFNFTQGAELTALQATDAALHQSVLDGFQDAGDLYSGLFADDVTLNLEINYRALDPGVLGSASNQTGGASYANVRAALIADATSTDDATAVANLQNSAALDFISNDRTGAQVRSTPADAWSNVLNIARSNLKALGLIAGNDAGTDATIEFSSSFNWDFDNSDGVTGNRFDFVGVAAHEIGHLLGFVSGVDTVDFFSGSGDGSANDLNGADAGIGELDDFRVFTVLDLFRYSADSLAEADQPDTGAVNDLRYGGNSFFSLDGGKTNLADFSTGSFNGNGNQASHWQDGQGLGLFDPTLAPNELGILSALDTQSLDVIGWDLQAFSTASVPEPSSFGVLALIAGASAWRRRRTAAKSSR